MKKNKKEKKERKTPKWLQIVKELWKHPRYKAMIKLGMYFVFVIGVLIFIQIANVVTQKNNKVVYKTPLEQFAEESSYQYIVRLDERTPEVLREEVSILKDETNHQFQITGNTNHYIIQNNLYYLNSNGTPLLVENPVTFDLTRFTPQFLVELIGVGEEVSNTTYKSGVFETTYEIPLNKFIKQYANQVVDASGIVTCKVQYQHDKVIKIYLEWTDYRKLQNPILVSSSITISFQR